MHPSLSRSRGAARVAALAFALVTAFVLAAPASAAVAAGAASGATAVTAVTAVSGGGASASVGLIAPTWVAFSDLGCTALAAALTQAAGAYASGAASAAIAQGGFEVGGSCYFTVNASVAEALAAADVARMLRVEPDAQVQLLPVFGTEAAL
jgi:hypothetical protein